MDLLFTFSTILLRILIENARKMKYVHIYEARDGCFLCIQNNT